MNDAKSLLAALLAVVLVFSPTVDHFSLVESLLSNLETKQDTLQAEETITVGQEAPDFEMVFLDGTRSQLSDFEGKTVVLYFWSPRSPACWKDIWFVNKLHQAAETNQVVLAVYTGSGKRVQEVEAFLERRRLRLPVALCSPDVAQQYKIKAVPVLLIIDHQRKIVTQLNGEISENWFH